MLKAEGISVTINGKSILQNVSFHLREGQWMMLCGPNGAGKSTLVSAVSGAIPCEGHSWICGKANEELKPRERAVMMGVLKQQTAVSAAYTAEQIVAMGLYARRSAFSSPEETDRGKVRKALEVVGMEEFGGRNFLTLSGGEQQRIYLAQVFCQDPAVLILDEPANHLDLPYQKHIFELIDQWRQEKGRAVLSVVHDLTLARRYATHALLLSHGRVLAKGTSEEVLTGANLCSVYGMDIAGWMKESYKYWERTE